jgi:hypothetical protein
MLLLLLLLQVLDLIKDGYLPLEGSVLHQKQEALVEVKPQ